MPTHLQHIGFLFLNLKNESAVKTKSQRAAPRAIKKQCQQNLPKANLHNVILCNSSDKQGVRGAL